MLASVQRRRSQAAGACEPLAGTPVSSERTQDLKREGGREKKARASWATPLDGLWTQRFWKTTVESRRIIKDAMRSVFKDESEGPPPPPRSPLTLPSPPSFPPVLLLSVTVLWRCLTCYCRRRELGGRSSAASGICPRFSTAAAMSVVCVCVCVCVCVSGTGRSDVSNLVTTVIQ